MASIDGLKKHWRTLGVHVISRAKSINDYVLRKEGQSYELQKAPTDNRFHWLFCQNTRFTHISIGACEDLCHGGSVCFASCFECTHCRVVTTKDSWGMRNPKVEKEIGEDFNPNTAANEGWL